MKDGLYQVLFICTGNICRSPMAEGILRARLSPRAAEYASVGSAGIAAPEGIPASENSIAVCREQRIDLSSHRSRQLTAGMVREADILLCMEEHHRQAIVRLVPEAREKTRLLAEYAESAGARGVPDPIGQGLEFYRQTFRSIESYLGSALPRIEASISEAGKSV